MKYNILLSIILLAGCNSSKLQEATLPEAPPPPPKVDFIPPAPSFEPDLDLFAMKYKEIQINRLPHPFNLNGSMPYAIWVDGKKLKLSPKETRNLAETLNLKFEQPEDTAEIHSGEGWLFPKQIRNQEEIVAPFEKEEEIFIDN
tara:strand:+ start:59454 stop:59885 length:432 start_codon:yes stop_codon:yes gene_type:complete